MLCNLSLTIPGSVPRRGLLRIKLRYLDISLLFQFLDQNQHDHFFPYCGTPLLTVPVPCLPVDYTRRQVLRVMVTLPGYDPGLSCVKGRRVNPIPLQRHLGAEVLELHQFCPVYETGCDTDHPPAYFYNVVYLFQHTHLYIMLFISFIRTFAFLIFYFKTSTSKIKKLF